MCDDATARTAVFTENQIRDAIATCRRISEMRDGSQAVLEEYGEAINLLRKFIHSGGTTGDRVMDFIIISRWSLGQEAYDRYRSIEERLLRHAEEGEFVLVVERRVSMDRRFAGEGWDGCMPQVIRTQKTTQLCLGILTGKGLQFDFSATLCSLPTSRYVQYTVDEFGKLRPREGAFTPAFHHYLGVGESGEGRAPELEIQIGDEDVSAWFGGQKAQSVIFAFWEMARALGRQARMFPALEIELKRRRHLALDGLKRLLYTSELLQLEIAFARANNGGEFPCDGREASECRFKLARIRELQRGIRDHVARLKDLGFGEDELVVSFSLRDVDEEYSDAKYVIE